MTVASPRTSAFEPVLGGETRPRRIAILLPDLRLGGAERVSLDLAREFVRVGNKVDFVLMRECGVFLEDLPEGARVINLKAPRLRNVAKALGAYLRNAKPDALLANFWPLTGIAVVVRKLNRLSMRVVTVDHVTLSAQYANWGALNWVALRASIAFIYPLADACIAVSQGVADDISALGRGTPGRFLVVFNPVPKPALDRVTRALAENAWNGWNGSRLITVGTLKEQKNHALLLKAFQTLVKTRDARLMILGDGPLFNTVAGMAREMGLGEKIVMPGTNRFPGPFYESADLFVLSSNYEGLPTVLIEALACGLPVVSTDCKSGPREILENGRYGALTPVGDAGALAQAMLEALNKTHARDVLRRRAADFSPEKAAEQYLRIMFPETQRTVDS